MTTHFSNSPTSSSSRKQRSSATASSEEVAPADDHCPGDCCLRDPKPQTPHSKNTKKRTYNSGDKNCLPPAKRRAARETYTSHPHEKRRAKKPSGPLHSRKDSAETQDPQEGSPVAEQDKYRNKLKTELCSYFSQTGSCRWADKCMFAHGPEEMKAKTHVSIQYKTKKCENYAKSGFCPYGHRCLYIHNFSYVSMLETFSNKFVQSEGTVGRVEFDRFVVSQHFTYASSDLRVKRLPVFAALIREAAQAESH